MSTNRMLIVALLATLASLTLAQGPVAELQAWAWRPAGVPFVAADSDAEPRSPAMSKIHPSTERRFAERSAGELIKVWVLFADKGLQGPGDRAEAVRHVAEAYHPRAVERRSLRRTFPGLFDWHDIPVVPAYVQAVARTGADVHVVSSWINGVSVRATREHIQAIALLPFVEKIQPVQRGRIIEPTDVRPVPRKGIDELPSTGSAHGRSLAYGQSEAQLAQMNLVAFHDQGYTGDGVVVGILDTGFERSHEAFNHPDHPVSIIAEWDFVDNDGNTAFEPGDPGGQHNHGTYILGTLAAYNPGVLIGAAFDASFILSKTEDTTGEYPAEEDNYVAGLQFIEANGGDMATSSLGYIDWYTQEDLDGMTAVTTLAINIATANGVHCCTAAGNGGHDTDPATSHLIAPADAPQVITCGAVAGTGTIASFSSDGPTADGRVKPEVLARGIDTRTVSPGGSTDYVGVNGTSLSTPLVAGAVACLIQAHPDWSVDQMRNYLFRNAQDFTEGGTYDHRYVRGFGVVDVLATSAGDCNGNAQDDALDIAGGVSQDCNENGLPDECDLDQAGGLPDCNKNTRPDSCDLIGGSSLDDNGNGIPDECELPPAVQPAEAAAPHDITKNRYISFAPNNGVNPVIFQVTLADGPGAPLVLGAVGEPDAGGVSRLVPMSVVEPREWLLPVIHVGDCPIVPGAAYEIRATSDGTSFTDPLLVCTTPTPLPPPQRWWGDVVGARLDGQWGGPDGIVNMTDLQAAVQTFEAFPGAPHWTRVDLEEEVPNGVVNLGDIQFVILAFEGAAYPFRTPAECP